MYIFTRIHALNLYPVTYVYYRLKLRQHVVRRVMKARGVGGGAVRENFDHHPPPVRGESCGSPLG
jgi:hypothetical protein